jgi:uncharacterized protein
VSTDRLTKSAFVQMVEDGGEAVVWHSLFGYPQIFNNEALKFLDTFVNGRPVDDAFTDAELQALNGMKSCFFVVPEGFDERELLAQTMSRREADIDDGTRVEFLELIMSEACNFRCTYCIHFNNLEMSERIDNPHKFMTVENGERAIDAYLNILREHGKRAAVVNFGGGEPLIVWKRIHEIMRYCLATYGQEFDFRFLLNTNASLITPSVAATLRDYSVSVATSLDGTQSGNDSVRLSKSGRGTYDKIVKGFNNLRDAGYPISGFSVTVTEANFNALDESVIDWAIERGMKEVRIDIDVIDMVDVPIPEIVERLMRIKRYASSRGVDVPGFWSRPAENLGFSTLDIVVAFCGGIRGNSMCVSPSGRIYGCGYSNTQLGDMLDVKNFIGPNRVYSNFVKAHQTGLKDMCRGCMIEGQCAGGCYITHEFEQETHSDKLARMCEFYRAMTTEILLEQLRLA